MAAPDILSNRLLEELRRYVVNELPIHLIHLQSTQLCDRQAVLNHFVPIFSAYTLQDLPEDLRNALLSPVPSSADTAHIRNFIRCRLQYAILSDRWGEPEPAYGDVPSPATGEERPNRYNVAKFCEVARSYNLLYAWADSCCINRASDSELNRSIRAMYRWYANASVCIAHLEDATSIHDLAQDGWFRRGWTLLQLLAPERLKFYSKTWAPLTNDPNDKASPEVLAAIQAATSISAAELQQFNPTASATYQISKRMRWAANRRTALSEDRAYSLMGVFGIATDVAYGEGEPRAFAKLFKEITHLSNSPEVVNWVGDPLAGVSLRSLGYPTSPDSFIGSNDVVGLSREEPISLAANGLSIKLLVLPATLVTWETPLVALLTCFGVQVRVDCLPDFKPGDPGEGRKLEYALGGWNFSTVNGQCRRSSDLVEAILLYRVSSREGWSRIPTHTFIRLELKTIDLPHGAKWNDFLRIVVL